MAMMTTVIQRQTKVCSYCFQFIDSLEEQIRLLCNLKEKPKLPMVKECFYDPPPKENGKPQVKGEQMMVLDEVKCTKGCGESYCSATCESKAMDEYHSLMCPGTDELHPWRRFIQHAEEENDGFLLAAKMLCIILRRAEQNDGNLREAFRPFAVFVTGKWWEILPHDDLSMTENEWRTDLKNTLLQSLELLKTALPQYVQKWPQRNWDCDHSSSKNMISS
jgi:hypothetical protein